MEALNLQDNDGMPFSDLSFPRVLTVFTEDVWDEESAYLDMLATEVNEDVISFPFPF